MKYKLLIFILLLAFSCQASNRFSDKINLKKFAREYWEIDRNKSSKALSKTNIINLTKKYSEKYNIDLTIGDTIFILETCSIESNSCYGSLWSQRERINFEFYKTLKLTSRCVFKIEETEALFKWDINTFKSMDEKGRSWLPSNTRYATRIIICKGVINVDRIEYLY